MSTSSTTRCGVDDVGVGRERWELLGDKQTLKLDGGVDAAIGEDME